MAQALGGLVHQRTDPFRHYALQKSELLFQGPAEDQDSRVGAILADVAADAVAVGPARAGHDDQKQGDACGRRRLPSHVDLLYHHNDEVGEEPLPCALALLLCFAVLHYSEVSENRFASTFHLYFALVLCTCALYLHFVLALVLALVLAELVRNTPRTRSGKKQG